jgi:hypothetical protein
MSTVMADGSPRLPDGTHIRYTDHQGGQRYARIAGTDMGRTKYEVSDRFMGWSEWRWMDGGSWVFLNQFEVVTEEEATAIPAAEENA